MFYAICLYSTLSHNNNGNACAVSKEYLSKNNVSVSITFAGSMQTRVVRVRGKSGLKIPETEFRSRKFNFSSFLCSMDKTSTPVIPVRLAFCSDVTKMYETIHLYNIHTIQVSGSKTGV